MAKRIVTPKEDVDPVITTDVVTSSDTGNQAAGILTLANLGQGRSVEAMKPYDQTTRGVVRTEFTTADGETIIREDYR